jgi:hypothetical protein
MVAVYKPGGEKVTAGLEATFSAGRMPFVADFLGKDGSPAEWDVTMLSGPIPNMGGVPLHHRKRFGQSLHGAMWVGRRLVKPSVTTLLEGCNLMLRHWQWGNFFASSDLGWDGRPVMVLNYDVLANGLVTRKIRDHVRVTAWSDDVMIGMFHVEWRKKLRFFGYFSLTRR